MKFKKTICSVLLLATVCATKVFAMGEDPRIGQLREYMKGVCAKVISPENTNPYVTWAKQYVSPTELPMTIYQLWASSGYNCVQHSSNLQDLYLPTHLKETFIREAKDLITSRAGKGQNPLKPQELRTRKKFIAGMMLGSKGERWMVDSRAGMGVWASTYALQPCCFITYQKLADDLKGIENRSDFFGNCVVATAIAANKCTELGLDWQVLLLPGGHFYCTFEVNGTRYVVYYALGVRKLAHNQPADDVVQTYEQFMEHQGELQEDQIQFLNRYMPCMIINNPTLAPNLL